MCYKITQNVMAKVGSTIAGKWLNSSNVAQNLFFQTFSSVFYLFIHVTVT